MQLLYIIDTANDNHFFKDPIRELQKQLDKSRELFVYLIYFISEVARFAETDAKNRAAKNLITTADLNVNIKIAGNEILWQILASDSFKKASEIYKPDLKTDKELIRKIYLQLVESELYQSYLTEQSRDKKKEKEILQFIFTNLLLPNENFESHVTELFNNWDDDAEMMEQLVYSYLQKPSAYNIDEMVTKEKWEFAKNLLVTMQEKKEYALELIKPKLKNWYSERIAVIDMIIMQMGVCELLYFETIPPKVTINEYIDIAKDYSTPQSGQFVNGILDSIHKELSAAGKIQKIVYKQKA